MARQANLPRYRPAFDFSKIPTLISAAVFVHYRWQLIQYGCALLDYLQGRDRPVTVTGPVGIKALVEGVMGKCESDEGEEAILTEDGKPTYGGMDPRPFQIKFRELAAPEVRGVLFSGYAIYLKF